MTTTHILALALILANVGSVQRPSPEAPIFLDPADLLTSSSTLGSHKSSAQQDTFYLFGGPGSNQGGFSHPSGYAMTRDDLTAEGWTFVDASDEPPPWHRSTFRMENLGGVGPGNHGMWAGVDAADAPGWATAPGYGNAWNALLEFVATTNAPSQSQVVGLDFRFNLDTEPDYDYLIVEYDSAGAFVPVYSREGTNKDASGQFPSPGLLFSEQSPRPILYAGDDYSTDNRIRLRIRAMSDGAWSDEDGLWDSDGFAQVDAITVTYHDGTTTQTMVEDFEGPGPYHWIPEPSDYIGYFGKVFAHFQDIDPCRSNVTPLYGFMDDGTGPYNPGYVGTGTGGTTSVNWSYGVSGGWVVNYNNGVSNTFNALDNRLVTPEIPWDLPGPDDDDSEIAGAQLRFSVWSHLPLSNGLFFQWEVRARDRVSGAWTAWGDNGFVQASNLGDWWHLSPDVSKLIATENGPDAVQASVGVQDVSLQFAFAGTDATPSPLYDSIVLLKYRAQGPIFSTRTIDLFQDGFPQSGATDHATQAARDAMDVRIDMARGVSTGRQNIAGDSVIVDVMSIVPGHTIDPSNLRLRWALHRNPYFETPIRENLTGFPTVTNLGGIGQNSWDVFVGDVVAQQSTTSAGNPVARRYFFDLPDQDFFYPGDVLQYYIEGTDSGGLTSTLPTDITGFATSEKHRYARTFTVRALPTLTPNGQPGILVLNEFGHRGGENEYFAAFGQLGWQMGARASSGGTPGDYDIYTVQGPTSGVDNGIGSAGVHGASGDQLAGYRYLVYLAGNLKTFLLSNGTDSGLNDKGDDLATLTAWHNQDADRYAVYFGDGIGTSHASTGTGTGSQAGDTYRTSILGVNYNDNDVRDEIGGGTIPVVAPTGNVAQFSASYFVDGGCPQINRFDSIDPRPGAVLSHAFVPGGGGAARTAGIVWDRTQDGFRKVNVTFPYGFLYVGNTGPASTPGYTARATLLSEVFDLFGGHTPSGVPTGAEHPRRPSLHVDPNRPNPFNPSTTIRFTLGVEGPVTLKVFDVAGRVVRTLADAMVFVAGSHTLTWDGRDGSGKTVASGVYIAKIEGNGNSRLLKMALIK